MCSITIFVYFIFEFLMIITLIKYTMNVFSITVHYTRIA